MVKWPDLMSGCWRQGRDMQMLVVSMTTRLAICLSAVAGLVVQTQHGPVVAIIHQADYHGKGSTILSSAQMEAYKIKVDDRSIHVGGSRELKP